MVAEILTELSENVDVLDMNIDQVMSDDEYKEFKDRLNNPENLCSNRYIVTRFNAQSQEYEALVLGINSTAGHSEFSKNKAGKVEIPGGKYFEYFKNLEEGVGPQNKDEVLAVLEDPTQAVNAILAECSEEIGVPNSYVKRVKLLKTFERPFDGTYKLDPKVKNKVSDLFVVELPPYAEINVNNAGSDDDHALAEWVPLKELNEHIDAASSKEVLEALPKNNFPEIFESIRGDISSTVLTEISKLFNHLNAHSNYFDEIQKGKKEKKNVKSKLEENMLRSFVDFGRVDSVRLKDLQSLFFTAFETDKNEVESDLENRIKKHFNSALEYEQEHRGVEYSPEFLAVMSTAKLNDLSDVHNFIRGYRKHPDYKPEWKNWCLNVFKVAYCYHYLEKAIPSLYKLDKYAVEFSTDVNAIHEKLGQRFKNPAKKTAPYEIMNYFSNPKAIWRIVDKLMTKSDFTIADLNDALRGRYVFKSDEDRKKFINQFEKDFNSKCSLSWEHKKTDNLKSEEAKKEELEKQKSGKRGTEIKAEGMYPVDGVFVPMEMQFLLEDEFLETESHENHHDVYVDLIKSFKRNDRLEEVLSTDVERVFEECLENPKVLAGEKRPMVAQKINNRLRKEFIRIPSISDPNIYAYYDKKNLLNTIGEHLRADEDNFFMRLMEYLAQKESMKIHSLFDIEEPGSCDKFDQSLMEFVPELMPKIPAKKRKTLEIYLRSKVGI